MVNEGQMAYLPINAESPVELQLTFFSWKLIVALGICTSCYSQGKYFLAQL